MNMLLTMRTSFRLVGSSDCVFIGSGGGRSCSFAGIGQVAHGWTVQAATGAMMDAARRREPPLRCEAVRGRRTSALQQLRGPLHFHVSTYKATARQQQAWKTGKPLKTYRRPPPLRKSAQVDSALVMAFCRGQEGH